MIVAFFLSMPNVGSWDGKWSGVGKLYVITAKVKPDKADAILKAGGFYYNFGDGWGASIHAKAVDSKEAAKLRKASQGFYGYDWMVREILDTGRILTLAERYPAKAMAQ